MNHTIYAIVGPSGSGKTTICNHLTQVYDRLQEIVSFTTREPRDGEVDGVTYDFIDVDEFRAMVDAGDVLEWAEYHGNYYGTTHGACAAPSAEDKDAVIIIERHGLSQIRAAFGKAVQSMLILPPNIYTLRKRLERRGDPPDRIKRRLSTARQEIANRAEFDHVIINDDLECALRDAEAITALR